MKESPGGVTKSLFLYKNQDRGQFFDKILSRVRGMTKAQKDIKRKPDVLNFA